MRLQHSSVHFAVRLLQPRNVKGIGMGKRKQSGIDIVASMQWPAGIVIGLIGYIGIRHGIGWYLSSVGSPVLSGLGQTAASGIYAPIAWVLLAGCWAAALASFIRRVRRRKLLDSQTGIDSLRQMSWREFEQLSGEAFRRQGYAIEETGLGGADGGIDLILRKGGLTTLVQCKQWRNRQVGVSVVREMYGLLVDQQAAAVMIVALGDYTADARRFAQGKPIELIHGGALINTVRSLHTCKARATGPMDSPLTLCGSMVAGLLIISVLSSTNAKAPSPSPIIPSQVIIQPTARAISAPSVRPAATPPRATISLSNSQDSAELRGWKKRNAESMKILEKTTKEMPLR